MLLARPSNCAWLLAAGVMMILTTTIGHADALRCNVFLTVDGLAFDEAQDVKEKDCSESSSCITYRLSRADGTGGFVGQCWNLGRTCVSDSGADISCCAFLRNRQADKDSFECQLCESDLCNEVKSHAVGVTTCFALTAAMISISVLVSGTML